MEYQSHFGVYALILNEARDRVLLIKKALGCYTGLYDLPGGAMEPHELLEEAMRREVLEETDCTVETSEQLGAFSTLYPFEKDGQSITLRHLGVVYTATVSGTPLEHSDRGDDSHGCVWVPFDDVTNDNAAPFVVDAVKAYRG
ncbi:MAG: NUDIX domain-containing protein [Alphaproteobacteria bacterium]|nr:NUDIX domain-containing protein [Alphaproteobacteria bacterium]